MAPWYGSMDDRERKAAKEQLAAWMKEQIRHVWCALALDQPQKASVRDLRVRREGKETFYEFWYLGSCLAEARGYFSREDGQWKFELTWVEPGHYPQVKKYFTRDIHP